MRHSFRPAIVLCISLMMAGLGSLAGEKPVCKWLGKPVDDQTFKTFLDFFTYDQNLPFKFKSIELKESEGLRKNHLSFQSTSGEYAFANLYSPMTKDPKKAPAIIFLHGGLGQGKDHLYNVHYAELLARAGYVVLAFDMKYFGERSTDLLTAFTEKDKHDHLYNQPSLYLEWVIQTVKDVRRSFDFLVNQIGIDSRRIGLFGFSRGGVIGAIAGGIENRLVAVLLFYGGHFDALEVSHLAAACPGNFIGRIRPRPLLMINANQDADFNKETSVLPLYELANPPKEIIWVEGGHGSLPEEASSRMLKWLQEKIK